MCIFLETGASAFSEGHVNRFSADWESDKYLGGHLEFFECSVGRARTAKIYCCESIFLNSIAKKGIVDEPQLWLVRWSRARQVHNWDHNPSE